MLIQKSGVKIIIFGIIGLVLIGMISARSSANAKPSSRSRRKGRATQPDRTRRGQRQGSAVVQVVIPVRSAGEIIALPVKEGANVKKGDLPVQIKQTITSPAGIPPKRALSAIASRSSRQQNSDKADAEYVRNKDLFAHRLVRTRSSSISKRRSRSPSCITRTRFTWRRRAQFGPTRRMTT